MDKKIKYIQENFTNNTIDTEAIVKEYALQQKNNSSIAIKILSVVGGVFSSLLFVLFVGISMLWTRATFMEIFGVILIIIAVFLNKKVTNLLLDTFSISLYIVGVSFVVFGLNYLKNPLDTSIYFVLLVGVIILFINQSYILSFIASMMILGSILLFLFHHHIEDAISVYLAINGFLLVFWLLYPYLLFSSKKMNALYEPIKMALVFSFLFILGLIAYGDIINMNAINWSILALSISIQFLFVVYKIKKSIALTDKKGIFILSFLSVLIAGLSYFSPAIIGALTVILLGFYTSSKSIFVLGILAFIYFIGQFYYNLNDTLLFKSVLLIALGIVFLALHFFVLKFKSLEKI